MTTTVMSFLTTLGATMIGTVTSETADAYEVKDALHATLVPQGQNVAAQFSPISMYGKYDPTTRTIDFTLQKIHVIIAEEVNDDIRNGYNQATGKIQVAPASSLIDLGNKRP